MLKTLPNRIAISGHTDATRQEERDGYSAWELSADRANAARRVLAESGVPNDRFHSVAGKAASEPLFPEDPQAASNRRLSILIMAEPPPFPPGHRPGR